MSSIRSNRASVAAAASIAAIGGLLATWNYLEIPQFFEQRMKSRKVEPRCYSVTDQPSLAAFKTLTSQITLRETYPLAADIQKNIPIYDARTFDLTDQSFISALQDELHHILLSGPGVFVIQHFFPDPSLLDPANVAFDTIIAHERAHATHVAGDHFAPASANSRIWNSFSKHALTDPVNFLAYYGNPLFPLVSEAYLGPAYRLTTQVNLVRPGGQPQVSHRDYHLGFQSASASAAWPKATHAASALLTLQGAVAHTEMPEESGPTRFLPFSQQFAEGYVAFRRGEFDADFRERWVSVGLRKGDAVFFSPALVHAAGENRTADHARSANLVQVSSAFGKTMETVNSVPLVGVTWELLREKYRVEGWSGEVEAFVKAVAEGYPFPTNLDRRPPAPGGMAPESEQEVLRRALGEDWGRERVVEELTKMKRDSEA